MGGLSVTLLVVAVLAMAVDWWSVWSDRLDVEQLAKPAVMIALIGVAFSIDPDPSSVRLWILIALALGLVGDVALLASVDRFVVGLGAFLLGHLAYVMAFVAMWNPNWLVAVGIAATIGLVGGFGTTIVRAVRASRLAVPVAGYLAVSSALMVLGASTGRWLATAGVLAFGLSDSLLGHHRFVTPRPRGRVVVHALYHLAQAAIVVSTTMAS